MALNDRLGAHLATFCALLPLADPSRARVELESWPVGAASPFARVGGTHFARFVVLDRGLPRQVAGQPGDALGPTLMLSAFFDDAPDAWLAALCAVMPEELDRVFASCVGCPGGVASSGHAVRAWLVEHRIAATAIFGAYPDASLADVRSALDFRARLREFAFGLESQRTAKTAFRAFAAGEGGAR